MELAFELEAVRRLPLADAALRLLDYALDDDFLDDVYRRHRGRSYEGVIRFTTFVHLIADALVGHRGSAHQTFRAAQDHGTVDASLAALYGKLRRVPIGLSQALFVEASARLAAVAVPDANRVPPSLGAFRLLAFDGKKIKHVAKRLRPLRGLNGTVIGGKMLVVQDVGSGRAVAFEATAEGVAADNPLVAGAVAQVRALADKRPRLWIGDRAFCDYQTPALLAEDPDHFVVRYHSKCPFVADPAVPVRTGTDENGRDFRDETGWLGRADNPQRIRVRRLTLARPGDEPIVVITSLLDAQRYPAADLLAAYRLRWGIEAMFLDVTQTFDLRHLIGATPSATVFQAGFCLLLYNVALTVRGYLAEAAKLTPLQVSLKLLFEEVRFDLTAWTQCIGPAATADVLAAVPLSGVDGLKQYLRRIVTGVWQERWRKSKGRPRGPKAPPRAYLKGGFSSVAKIVRGEHVEIPLDRNKPPPTPGEVANPSTAEHSSRTKNQDV